jgi:hypothetical protein
MRILYILIFFILFFSSELLGQSAQAPDGSGTVGDPYQIATLNNLYWITQNSSKWDKHYVQTADIDASSTSGWAGGFGFSPIGNNATTFTGTYNGNNFNISGLYIFSNWDWVGLFGKTVGAELSNIILSNVDITGRISVGALVGENTSSSLISHCQSSGTVSLGGTGGGLVGVNDNSIISYSHSSCTLSNTSGGSGGLAGNNMNNGSISYCFTTGNVSSSLNYAGGLVAVNQNSNISNSYSTGIVSGTYGYVGGLVGYALSSSAISESYSSSTVSGVNYIGALVGCCVNSTITNSNSSGSSEGTLYIGGLVGKLEGASVSESYSTACVSGASYIGGLVGMSYSASSINASYSTGTCSAKEYSGAFIGWNQSSIISNSYCLGDITRTSGTNAYLGAFCGYNYSSTIAYCYSTGDVIYDGAANPTDKGFVAGSVVSPTYTNNFWDSDASNQTTATGATARTTAQMKTKSTFTGASWDFVGESANGSNDYWDMNTDINSGYPYNIGPFSGGAGTVGDPYQISNLTELRNLSENSALWDNHFIQTADIDASITNTWNSGAGFSPIGNNTNKFTGSYDGDFYTIDALFINRSATDYIGLFGYAEGADIDAVGLTNVEIEGNDWVGGLIGYNSVGTTITHSYSEGNVIGNQYVGGLMGRDYSASIQKCYSTGTVAGMAYVGGFSGYNYSSALSNVFTRSDIIRISGGTSSNIGAFSGRNFNSSIVYSYATGSVVYDGASNPTSKGFLGSVSGSYTHTSNFFDKNTSGQTSGTGATSKTTAEMKTQSTFTGSSWDFVGETSNGTNDIWLMSTLVNDGYPGFSAYHNYWKGTLGTVWNTAGNWSWNSIPSADQNVHIPDVSNDPVIHDHVVCNNLSLENGASLTINSGKSLSTSGDIVNEGTVLIKSDEYKSGSLINTGSISGSGTVTIERYASKSKYHYLASPVNTHAKSVFSSAHDFYEYIPGTGWNSLKGSGGTLTNAKGYAIQNKDNNVVYSFSGTPNYGRVSISVTKAGTDGMNLIGNPYPASIDLGTANVAGFLTENASHISGSVYLWDDPGTFGGYASNDYASFNGTTGVAGSRGGHQPTRYISACQGFFVHRASAGSASLLFTDKMRCTEASPHFYSPEETGKKQILRLSLENDQNAYNQIAIGFLEEASLGFDNLYDARKMKANPSLAFYSLLGDEELVIQGLPKLDQLGKVIIPLGVESYSPATYSISAEDHSHFKSSTGIFLEDIQEEVCVDLREQKSYTFSLAAQQRITDRFFLHIIENYSIRDTNIRNPGQNGEVHTGAEENKNGIHVYAYADRIYFVPEGSGFQKIEFSLHDLMGREICRKQLTVSTLSSVRVSVPEGCYVLRTKQDKYQIISKVFMGFKK